LLGKDRKRHLARVIAGCVEQTASLIDTSKYAQKYVSGCLSFSEADIPEKQKKEIMGAFEKTIFCGLDKSQYDILWIEHLDKSRLELNFLIPTVELTSGKRFQPYFDPADRKRVDAFQTFINATYGFSDPHDPARSQTLLAPRDISCKRQEAARKVTEFILYNIQNKTIKTRNDIINLLVKSGIEVSRQTSKSISIRKPNSNVNIRLQGTIYQSGFDSSTTKKAQNVFANLFDETRLQRMQSARCTLTSMIENKSEYHHKRYHRKENSNGQVSPVLKFIRAIQEKIRIAIKNNRVSSKCPIQRQTKNGYIMPAIQQGHSARASNKKNGGAGKSTRHFSRRH
jgi:hypothetical protein